MSIIVTGATGQYGRAVTEQLLKVLPPEDLILVTRKPERLAALAARGAKVRKGDFDDPDALPAAFEGGERMMLISTARVGRRVGQHGNAIAAAAKVGVRQIAYTSFIGLHLDNPALVTKDHRNTETLMRESGVAWTALRDSQYAEAAAEVIAPMALASGKWFASAEDGRIAMVARQDCVACAAAVLTTPGHDNTAYDITGPELMSYAEICAMVGEIAGRALEYVRVDDEGMRDMFDRAGVPREASDDPTSFERAIREGHFAVISDSVQKLTGRPATPLREVLMAHKDKWPV